MACSCLWGTIFLSLYSNRSPLQNRLRGIPMYIPAMTEVPRFMYFYLYLSGPVRMPSSQPSLQLHHMSRVRAPGPSVWADWQMWLTHHCHSHGTCSPVGGQTLKCCWLERNPGIKKVRVAEWEMYLVVNSCRSFLSKHYKIQVHVHLFTKLLNV